MKVKIITKKFEKINKSLLTKIAKQVLKIFNQEKAQISVSVFFATSEEIKHINKETRNIDKPTDVLSFRLVENEKNLPLTKENFVLDFDHFTKTINLGDIFICPEIAEKQAPEFNNSKHREMLELFIHGMLHLLGCDHHKEQETKIMKDYENQMMQFLDKKKIF